MGSASIMVLMSLLVFAPPALPAGKTLALVSRGAKANYQMEFLRLHKGVGTDTLAGGNDAIQHLYLGNDIDDDFFGVRFFEADGTTPIAHRRMICQTGKYADFIIKLDLPDAGKTKKMVLDYVATGRATESSDAALENICFYGWVRQGAKRNGWVHDQWGVENTTLVDNGKIRMWWHGSLNGGAGDYWSQGVMRYSESTDGLTWKDMGAATGFGPLEGLSFVFKDSDGLYYHPTGVARVADPSVKEFKGKTFLWYESQPDQSPTNVPWLSACTWDQPLDRMLDRTITTAVFDDLEAEGWTFDPGNGENNTATLSTVFRKLSDLPSPISENCVVVKTEPGRYLKIRKAIGALAAENVFEFHARAEQADKKFEAFRIDKDNTNGILAGVWFDTDGKIKYYSGTATAVARAYDASTYYRFQIFQKTGGYDLKINGATIANDIPYFSAYAAPAYFHIGQDAAATGYLSGLFTRQHSAAATEPVWGGVTATKPATR